MIKKLTDLLKPSDNSYKTLVDKYSDCDVIEHEYLICTPTLTQIFMLLKRHNSDKHVFIVHSYIGTGISEDTTYDDAKWRYDNAIKDTKESL